MRLVQQEMALAPDDVRPRLVETRILLDSGRAQMKRSYLQRRPWRSTRRMPTPCICGPLSAWPQAMHSGGRGRVSEKLSRWPPATRRP